MSEEAARVEGTSPARAGEAARQLIRRARQVTRRKFPAEEKIRIVLEGIRGEVAVSELCRREGIHPTIHYKWMKDFMEADKGRLRGDTKREATTEEVRQVGEENARPKQWVAELSLANLTLKRSLF
jgi:transposase